MWGFLVSFKDLPLLGFSEPFPPSWPISTWDHDVDQVPDLMLSPFFVRHDYPLVAYPWLPTDSLKFGPVLHAVPRSRFRSGVVAYFNSVALRCLYGDVYASSGFSRAETLASIVTANS